MMIEDLSYYYVHHATFYNYYRKYEQHSKKRFIEIDLHGQTVKQLETVNAVV